MERVIWKFELERPGPGGVSRIRTDKGRIVQVLSFELSTDPASSQFNTIVCWAIVAPEEGYVDERRFYLVNTGRPFTPPISTHTQFRSTIVTASGVVWHIFEVR